MSEDILKLKWCSLLPAHEQDLLRVFTPESEEHHLRPRSRLSLPPRERGSPVHRSPGRLGSPAPRPRQCCWYHNTFGAKTRRCKQLPCQAAEIGTRKEIRLHLRDINLDIRFLVDTCSAVSLLPRHQVDHGLWRQIQVLPNTNPVQVSGLPMKHTIVTTGPPLLSLLTTTRSIWTTCCTYRCRDISGHHLQLFLVNLCKPFILWIKLCSSIM
ncbi:hypothetical protein M0802_007930 [Mischocyttarus mexicanus]|nr:hypothetical protein M0802_007930 [Mischocyttarus mexicanus]